MLVKGNYEYLKVIKLSLNNSNTQQEMFLERDEV